MHNRMHSPNIKTFVTIKLTAFVRYISPRGNGDVLDSVVHKNIRLTNVIVSDILDSDHLPIIFHILDHVRTHNLSVPAEKFTDWERFQSLASNLISPSIQINSGVEADKAACAFTASVPAIWWYV
jgi:hypothetical protein